MRHAADDVVGVDLARARQPCGLQISSRSASRVLAEAPHALGLVGHHQGLLPMRVLGGDAGGAMAGVAVCAWMQPRRT